MTMLQGWGAQRRVDCDERTPETPGDVKRALEKNGTIARGLGRSYGDQALNEHRRVVTMTKLDRYLSFDEATGVLRCEAGVSLAQLITDFGPRGFFPAITPGTKFVTVGGCIANDVHGKAHHAQGTFVTCVESMQLLVADGRVVTASRKENADLFWATFGGLGLTGVVLEATLKLRKIETTYFRQKSLPARDLTHMLELLAEYDAQFPYSVATLNSTATGSSLGQGVLTVGDHATRDELPSKLQKNPLKLTGELAITVPFEMPEFTLNPLTIRALNGVITTMLKSKGAFEHYEGFFYPLDMIHEWYRGYGKRGFIQYQFVIPFEDGEKNIRELMTLMYESGQLPFLNILKRMGASNDAPLSFPMTGLTFAIDFPVRAGLVELTRQLDERVADMGGRVYLGKDSYLEAPMLRRMFTRVADFERVKTKWDPNGLFTSDIGRRLELSK
jgi:decaprenylphospho-beta-D-ribofuranose 2-oxidase